MKWILFLITPLAATAEQWLLDNGLVKAFGDSSLGLQKLQSKANVEQSLEVIGDSWCAEVNGTVIGWPHFGCIIKQSQSEASFVILTYTCGDFEIQVSYTLPADNLFLEKRLSVKVGKRLIAFSGASLFQDVTIHLTKDPQATWHVQSNPYNPGLHIAAFLRGTSLNYGAFLSIASPWGNFTSSAEGITASFAGTTHHRSSLQGPLFQVEPAVLGLTNLSKYSSEGLNAGERIAFMRCVEAYYLDKPSREAASVKVNVGWDENDYQIDVGTSEGQSEYKRIIDRNAEFGVTHLVYGPGNSLHSSRFNTTDGWGWEFVLWFSMGEKLREGTWDPRLDPIPDDILEMVSYANSKGVKLLAYVYPCLAFQKVKDFIVAKDFNSLSIAEPEVQTYFIEIMSAFLQKTGAGGFAWDHDIYAGDSSLQYSQWRAWMHILTSLRKEFKDLVMDHRQTAHAWGPWYHLAGSYAEPIAGDENPESYGVPMTSLHTDHVAANNMRIVNYVYSTQQLIPPSRIPGFAFHQTERTDDDGTGYCFGGQSLCVNNSNTRDFDFLGFKYSLLSSIGTAGLNNVLTMLPARDVAEYEFFPKQEVYFIQNWLSWTDHHLQHLANTQWIPTLPAPGLGHVDGTHAMSEDEGFLFLFNPNMKEMTVELIVDESIGLSNASFGSFWDVKELFPSEGHSASWKHGEQVAVTVEGSSVKILQLAKLQTEVPAVRLLNANMRASAVLKGNAIIVTDARAAMGDKILMVLRVQEGFSSQQVPLTVNGHECGQVDIGQDFTIKVNVFFDGDLVKHSMPISEELPGPAFKGGWYNTSFIVPSQLTVQLSARQERYPIPWTHNVSTCSSASHCVDDSKATWLLPSRLLLLPFLTKPIDSLDMRLFVDGVQVNMTKSYNSRGRQESGCFLGFYWDASRLLVETSVSHRAELWMPSIEPGSFGGLFWENVETEYTSTVSSCSPQSSEKAGLSASVFSQQLSRISNVCQGMIAVTALTVIALGVVKSTTILVFLYSIVGFGFVIAGYTPYLCYSASSSLEDRGFRSAILSSAGQLVQVGASYVYGHLRDDYGTTAVLRTIHGIAAAGLLMGVLAMALLFTRI